MSSSRQPDGNNIKTKFYYYYYYYCKSAGGRPAAGSIHYSRATHKPGGRVTGEAIRPFPCAATAVVCPSAGRRADGTANGSAGRRAVEIRLNRWCQSAADTTINRDVVVQQPGEQNTTQTRGDGGQEINIKDQVHHFPGEGGGGDVCVCGTDVLYTSPPHHASVLIPSSYVSPSSAGPLWPRDRRLAQQPVPQRRRRRRIKTG